MQDSERAVQPGVSPLAQWYMGLRAESEGGPAGGDGAEGQGAQSQGLDPGLYPGIETVPSEYRQYIDPILEQMNTNANKRIADVNEKLDVWKPYEELGVRDAIDPETMQGLIPFVEMLATAEDDPSSLQQWWEGIGNQFDFFGEPEGEGEGGEAGDELFGESEGPDVAELVRNTVQEVMAEQMAPFQQNQEQQERDQILGQANERIDNEFNQIKEKIGDFSDDPEKNSEIEARIIRLAIPYANDNNGEGSILKGFQEYQDIVKDAEGSLFQEVSRQPGKPEGPGTPDTTKEKPTDFKSANDIAKDRLAQVQN